MEDNQFEVASTDSCKIKKPQKTKAFIVVFVLGCIAFVAYALLYTIFCSMVFDQSEEGLENALEIIFGLILFLVPLFISFVFSFAFNFASAFCRKKGVKIPAIILTSATVVSFATAMIILFTR